MDQDLQERINYLEDRLSQERMENDMASEEIMRLEDRIKDLQDRLTEAHQRAAKAEDAYRTEVECSTERSKRRDEETVRSLGRQARCSLFIGVLVSLVFLVRCDWLDLGTGFRAVGIFFVCLVVSFVISLIVYVVFHLFTRDNIHEKDFHIHTIVCVVALVIGIVVAFA